MVWYWAQIGVTEIDGVHLDWWHLPLRLLVTCLIVRFAKHFGCERLHQADYKAEDDHVRYDIVGVEEDDIHRCADDRAEEEENDEAAAARHGSDTDLGRFMPPSDVLRRCVVVCHVDRSRPVMKPTVQRYEIGMVFARPSNMLHQLSTGYVLTLSRTAMNALIIGLISAAGCSDSSGPAAKPVASILVESGDNQEALAGATLGRPVVLLPVDADGTKVTGQTASFAVTSGGGIISSASMQAGPDGTIAAPSWTLGRSGGDQAMQVSIGNAKITLHAVVHSDLKVDLRFFGESLTADQRTIFSNAAERIRAVVVGSLPVADLSSVGSPACATAELPAPGASTDGVVIYAGAKYLDGVNKLLGASWTCNKRSPSDSRAAVGIVILDMADINLTPDDMRVVALHEMLHALGFGFWEERGLLTGFDTNSVAYRGPGGIAGCIAAGGAKPCTSSVPVQNAGGPGRANSHWRDSVFGEELMTSLFKTKPVLSVITIRSLEDLGYVVNTLAADPYSVISANANAIRSSDADDVPWESNRLPRK
jgi:hypothetical protein